MLQQLLYCFFFVLYFEKTNCGIYFSTSCWNPPNLSQSLLLYSIDSMFSFTQSSFWRKKIVRKWARLSSHRKLAAHTKNHLFQFFSPSWWRFSFFLLLTRIKSDAMEFGCSRLLIWLTDQVGWFPFGLHKIRSNYQNISHKMWKHFLDTELISVMGWSQKTHRVSSRTKKLFLKQLTTTMADTFITS